jgi:hypothetical protein
MARKVFQARLGFYDTIVAAPSQTSALAAWGSKQDLFQIGLAKQVDDPEAIKAAMAKPGIVLRRPYGSSVPFSENRPLPKVPSKARHGLIGAYERQARANSEQAQKAQDQTERERFIHLATALTDLANALKSSARLGEPLVMPRHDGRHMEHGHALTPRERERAPEVVKTEQRAEC